MASYLYDKDFANNAYPAPGGVTYGSRWLSPGGNVRPIPEAYELSQRGGRPTTPITNRVPNSQMGYPAEYRPSDPYNDRYMDTYNLQQRPAPAAPQTKSNANPMKELDNVIGDFSRDYTSAHGLPNIYKATTTIGRIFWTLVLLTGLGVCGWQFESLISKYIAFGTATEVHIVSDPQLGFPGVTVCNTNKVRRSQILYSQHREILFIDDQQPLPYYAPCIEGDYLCSNGDLCIKTYLLCDGINHCRDFSDEEGCVYGACGANQFRCELGGPDGYCISNTLECDRNPDCYHGFDEFDCECKESEWKCANLGGCIPRTARCDGVKHCYDNSDEGPDCPKADCTDGFLCSYSEQCIHQKFVCDLFEDCSDGSDETENACNESKEYVLVGDTVNCAQGSSWFNCGDGQCVPEVFVCDGDADCSNSGDEDPAQCGVTAARCTEEQFTCDNGWECIDQKQVCDIRPNCRDWSDEVEGCECFVTRGRTETSLQNVNCPSGRQSILRNEAKASGLFVQCSYGTREMNSISPAGLYECGGILYCSDPETGFVETCQHVFTECHVRQDGSDYKGKVYNTTVGTVTTVCLKWESELPRSLGWTTRKYPLLGDHPFCRNPGGTRDRPWCFKENAVGENDWMYCDVPLKNTSCFTGAQDQLQLKLVGGTSSQGRVEIITATGESATITDIDWTIEDGNVICRHLGFNTASEVFSNAYFGAGSGDVYFSVVDCSGEEQGLLDCLLVAAEGGEGNHDLDVGVSCTGTAPEEGGLVGGGGSVGGELPSVPQKRSTGQAKDHSVSRKRERRFTLQETDFVIHSKRRRGKRQLGVSDGYDEQELGDMFTCEHDGVQIPWYQTCNNYPDCIDGSDEYICGPSDRLCPLAYRPCRYESYCIESNFECDGRKDCRTGLDEKNCDDITCPTNYWKCTSAKLCIPRYAVCDTILDCRLGEDEDNCTNIASDVIDPFADTDWIDPYSDLIDSAKKMQTIRTFTDFYKRRSFERVKGEDPPDWKRFFTFSQQADYSDLTDVLKISRAEIRHFGHQLEDMILECYYDERECDIAEDFVPKETDEYGNCYTFNYKPNGNHKESNRSGPKHGLSLILYLEQDEYLSLYGQRTGARVAINQPDVQPLPEEEGFMIRPGVETSIGLRLNEIERLGGLYGTCTESSVEKEVIVDGVPTMTKEGAYDRRVCLQTCLNNNILQHCKCSSTIELDGPRCKVTNTKQDICVEFIRYLHQSNDLNCTCEYPCVDRFYTKTISQSVWPSDVYLKHLLRSIHAARNTTMNINDFETASKNLARLNVYFEELNYDLTKEIPAYESESLFSDIGGTLGLYIGFSVITAFEFIVLIYEICAHCGKKSRPPPQPRR